MAENGLSETGSIMKTYLGDLELDLAEAIMVVTETLADLPSTPEGRGKVVGQLYPLISRITLACRGVENIAGDILGNQAGKMGSYVTELNRLMSNALNVGDSVTFVIAVGEMLGILDVMITLARDMEKNRLNNSLIRRAKKKPQTPPTRPTTVQYNSMI